MLPPLGALMLNELLRGRRGIVLCKDLRLKLAGEFASEGRDEPIQHLTAGNVNKIGGSSRGDRR
jgi:hypothetical protein